MRVVVPGSRGLATRATWIAGTALAALFATSAPCLHAQPCDLLITELMAQNRTVLLDEDGDSSDWFEVHNPCADSVSLGGWFATDDPSAPTRWEFPPVTLEGGGYLIVFASGKDRRDPLGELHASFALAGEGEYLALVRPDGATPAHQYAPRYPAQRADFSYGIGQDRTITPLLGAPAPARTLVPQNDALGTAWTGGTEPFDDSGWTQGETGAGYLVSQPGFAVRVFFGSSLESLSTAEDLIRSRADADAVENAPFIDYYNTGGTGHYGGDRPFPGTTIGDDANDFALEATATILIPSAGAWTFGVSSDDGFGLDVSGNGESFRIEYPSPRGPADTLGVFDAPAAGSYDLRLVMYERGGGAEVELFAAQGSHASWSSTFRRVGDVAAGGLAAESQPVGAESIAGIRSLIGTDLVASMHETATSALVRVPFAVPDPTQHDSLTLRMKYDDGFVAWLNGVEVTRRNAPAVVRFDSTATLGRPPLQVEAFQEIDISEHLGALVAGENILAIHGLNVAAGDGDFLVYPELAEITVVSMATGLFDRPTPGAANGTLFTDFVADTTFEPDRGFYDAPFSVEITTETPGAVIRYTTDGSAPSETSGSTYDGPIAVTESTVLRAAAFKQGFLPTNVDTQTYVFLDDVLTQTGVGFPGTWGSVSADYEVDPNVVGDPAYAGEIRDDLLAIPSVSIVMDVDDLFDAGRGIYANSQSSGVAWERPGSVELLVPVGSEGPAGDGRGFQVTCGVRMHGGVGRSPSVPKHSFRFLFKGAYGPTKLDFPLFGDDAADSFDTLILRAGFNNSWVFNNSGQMPQAQYLRDQWIRDAGLDMGTPQPHGIFVHVYVNGLYWGVYNLVERPSAPFAAAYFGGDKEEWDVLNSSEPVDGSKDAWNILQAIAETGVATAEGYAAIEEFLDVPNLIDYMIFNFYGGNSDWDGHNWYAGRRRAAGAGYKFFSWDAERTLEGLGANRTDVNAADKPSRLYSQLRANEEFIVLFGDHTHRHCFNGGALSPEACVRRYQERAEEIGGAIVGESARWGDAHREPPFTRDVEWIAERDRILGSYLPQRTSNLIAQFRAAGLYPDVDAPRFSQHGGRIAPGFELIATATEGTIYFTRDGSDPRLVGGAVSPSAEIAGAVVATTLLAEGAPARVLVPSDGTLELSWTAVDFDDSGWIDGPTGAGYERSSGYEAEIRTDLEPLMDGATASFYMRQEFAVEEPASIAFLELRMKYDDGFIAYLNGERVEARNAPLTGAWNSTATGSHDDGAAVVFESFEIPGAADRLRAGTNVLAIHGLNVSAGSSDLLIVPELRTIEASGQGIALSGTTRIRSRALADGRWSALEEALFHVDAPLRITEIMYHPAAADDGSGLDADAYEFIELQNVGDGTLDVSGFRLAGGLELELPPGTSLGPKEVLLAVKSVGAFVERYPFLGVAVIGPYARQLGNGGDTVRLEGPMGEPLLAFDYSDGWYPETDGDGFSLVVLDPLAPPESWGSESSWTLSETIGGSPGFVEANPTPPGGRQLPGDLNQDALLEISDAIRLLRHLYGPVHPTVPCDGATIVDGANRRVADVNGDGEVDLSDPLTLLNHLILAGPPPALGGGCVRIEGCPTACP